MNRTFLNAFALCLSVTLGTAVILAAIFRAVQ